MKIRESLAGCSIILWYFFTGILWPMGVLGYAIIHQLPGVGQWGLIPVGMVIAYGPFGITMLLLTMSLKKDQRIGEEQLKAKRQAEAEENRRRREAEAQAKAERKESLTRTKLKEAQAFRKAVERFHRERLSIEQYVVGDEQAGIRSPYEVEMTSAETALLNTISSKFDPACLLVDTYLDKGDGTTTQIDIIAICRQGIIVIESKGIGGTITGRADDAEWIQKPSQKKIYSPIRQNDLHVRSICQVLKPTKTPAEIELEEIEREEEEEERYAF